MRFIKRLAIILMFFINVQLFSQESIIFVHGRGGQCGNDYTQDAGNYWGNAKNINTSLPRFFVHYDGYSDPRTWGNCRAQSKLYQVLEDRCLRSRGQSCVIICHSAGCYATEYFIATRDVSRYNIRFVFNSSSAAGGSELANLAFWNSGNMDDALKTGNARGSYNHNDMKGIPFYMLAGFKGWWYTAAILPGEDDGAVSFHSTCAMNTTGSFSNCNSGTRYSMHFIWTGRSTVSSWNNNRNGYDRQHSGDGSDAINTATRQEWDACRNLNLGCR
ncbi:MAG: hypothetical protein NZ853_04560 [Leptospiraceae bacterium]|nr:hypothetical protein [Leptospiraceae bacterium]MDW7975447.1 hypothetical protein [Leptospiraceae bacterium]